MTTMRQQNLIRALGKIEGFKYDIRTLSAAIEQAPLWRPGAGLIKQCDQCLGLIEELAARFDRQLVATIIGPCGSGKSTLLNALVGIDDLSTTGIDRPTTRKVVVFCGKTRDADFIGQRLGAENAIIRTSPTAKKLENVILVDTPDTDSVEHQVHIPIVKDAVALSDILICVFNGENPKTRDHVDFFTPYVQRFDGESLVCVLNRCDRLDEKELKDRIVPEFSNYIHAAWEKPVYRILCISARRNLNHPDWSRGAAPRHTFDQFDQLQEMVFGTFNQGGYVVDRRVGNAENLRDYVGTETLREVEGVRERLTAARQAIRTAEKTGLSEAAASLKNDGDLSIHGINTLLYQKLSGRWTGPVGWLVAAWARVMAFTGGVTAAIRYRRPFTGLLDATRTVKRFNRPSAGESRDAAQRSYRLAVMQHWPGIAEQLIGCGFEPAVRQIDNALPEADMLDAELSTIWHHCLDEAVEASSRKLSGWILQMLFNLPVIAVVAHMGWTTASEYVGGNYLPANYFLHAGIIIAVVLFLSFFLLQCLVRWIGGPERITRMAKAASESQVARLHPMTRSPLARQVEAVLQLVPDASYRADPPGADGNRPFVS
jgi:energy-coupling factor transporter ATP-binding protein EcfA2